MSAKDPRPSGFQLPQFQPPCRPLPLRLWTMFVPPMSRADGRDPEKGKAVYGHHAPSLPALHQAPQRENGFGDSSRSLFTMYSKLAEEDDNKMAERWQKDAEGIIIFNGLFSAVVAALVVLSIADLKPDMQEKSAFYLEKLYLIQITGNQTNFTAGDKYAFSPPRYSIWANSLWLLSLVISLTCAMLATSVQQWARRYITITQPARCSPKQRARMRAFFANGVDQFHVSWTVEALPALVHLSLIIFFAGLLIFLFNVNLTVFTAVVAWVGSLALVYSAITLMPIFRPDSPYYAPLSSTAWFLYSSIQDAFAHCRWEVGSIQNAAEEAALERSPEIDVRILEWTVDALAEDDAQEKFFESLPGFYKSDLVRDPLHGLPEEIEWKILGILNEFLRRTLSSNSVTGLVKSRRFAICLNVASEVRSSYGIRFICRQVIEDVNWSLVPESVDIGHFLRSWDKSTKGRFSQYIQGVIAHIVAGVWERNDRWVKLAMDHLGISEQHLQDYLAHGDSVLLANLIHLTRLISHTDWVTPDILRPLSRFDVHNTDPEVQHDFCTMWNELVLESRSKGALSRLRTVLKAIRPIFFDLHQDEAGTRRSKYPLCTNVGHRSGWTQDVQEASVLSVEEPIHPRASTSAPVMVQHPTRASAPARAAVTSSPLRASQGHTTPPLADELSPDDLPGPSVQSSHPVPRVPSPGPIIPFDFVTATSTQTMAQSSDVPSTVISDPHSTVATIAPVQQPASAPLSSGSDSPHDNGDHHVDTPSITPEILIASSVTTHSDDALPTDAQSAASTVTEPDLSHDITEDPPSNTATSPPLTAQQEASDTLTDDDLHDLDIPTPTVASSSQHPHHSTQLVPDITGESSLDTAFSSHDSDHTQ